jgi:hypothetical protein
VESAPRYAWGKIRLNLGDGTLEVIGIIDHDRSSVRDAGEAILVE